MKVHISTIKIGDTVLHNGKLRTVCKRVIRRCPFMGISLWGDCYNLGYKPVIKVEL